MSPPHRRSRRDDNGRAQGFSSASPSISPRERPLALIASGENYQYGGSRPSSALPTHRPRSAREQPLATLVLPLYKQNRTSSRGGTTSSDNNRPNSASGLGSHRTRPGNQQTGGEAWAATGISHAAHASSSRGGTAGLQGLAGTTSRPSSGSTGGHAARSRPLYQEHRDFALGQTSKINLMYNLRQEYDKLSRGASAATSSSAKTGGANKENMVDGVDRSSAGANGKAVSNKGRGARNSSTPPASSTTSPSSPARRGPNITDDDLGSPDKILTTREDFKREVNRMQHVIIGLKERLEVEKSTTRERGRDLATVRGEVKVLRQNLLMQAPTFGDPDDRRSLSPPGRTRTRSPISPGANSLAILKKKEEKVNARGLTKVQEMLYSSEEPGVLQAALKKRDKEIEHLKTSEMAKKWEIEVLRESLMFAAEGMCVNCQKFLKAKRQAEAELREVRQELADAKDRIKSLKKELATWKRECKRLELDGKRWKLAAETMTQACSTAGAREVDDAGGGGGGDDGRPGHKLDDFKSPLGRGGGGDKAAKTTSASGGSPSGGAKKSGRSSSKGGKSPPPGETTRGELHHDDEIEFVIGLDTPREERKAVIMEKKVKAELTKYQQAEEERQREFERQQETGTAPIRRARKSKGKQGPAGGQQGGGAPATGGAKGKTSGGSGDDKKTYGGSGDDKKKQASPSPSPVKQEKKGTSGSEQDRSGTSSVGGARKKPNAAPSSPKNQHAKEGKHRTERRSSSGVGFDFSRSSSDNFTPVGASSSTSNSSGSSSSVTSSSTGGHDRKKSNHGTRRNTKARAAKAREKIARLDVSWSSDIDSSSIVQQDDTIDIRSYPDSRERSWSLHEFSTPPQDSDVRGGPPRCGTNGPPGAEEDPSNMECSAVLDEIDWSWLFAGGGANGGSLSSRCSNVDYCGVDHNVDYSVKNDPEDEQDEQQQDDPPGPTNASCPSATGARPMLNRLFLEGIHRAAEEGSGEGTPASDKSSGSSQNSGEKDEEEEGEKKGGDVEMAKNGGGEGDGRQQGDGESPGGAAGEEHQLQDKEKDHDNEAGGAEGGDGGDSSVLVLQKEHRIAVRRHHNGMKKLISMCFEHSAFLFWRIVSRKNALIAAFANSHRKLFDEFLDVREQYELVLEHCDELETLNLGLNSDLLPELYAQIEDLTADRAFLLDSIKQYFNGKMLEGIDIYHEMERAKRKEDAKNNLAKGGKIKPTAVRVDENGDVVADDGLTEFERLELQAADEKNRLERQVRTLKGALWRFGPFMDFDTQKSCALRIDEERKKKRGLFLGGKATSVREFMEMQLNRTRGGDGGSSTQTPQEPTRQLVQGGEAADYQDDLLKLLQEQDDDEKNQMLIEMMTSMTTEMHQRNSQDVPARYPGTNYNAFSATAGGYCNPKARDASVQTDHRVLSTANLESVVIQKMSDNFEARIREAKRISDRQISRLINENEAAKNRFELLYAQMMQRIVNQSELGDRFQDPKEWIQKVINHLLKCQALQQEVITMGNA
ncbi:unnamed protein product [Amoebophrya sp. A25]|nr:unnamed protein product [Amoebophrya sp. A25]|eukprot:GSA25T00021854001.1